METKDLSDKEKEKGAKKKNMIFLKPRMYILERRKTDTIVAENIAVDCIGDVNSATLRRSQSDRTEYSKKLKEKMAPQEMSTPPPSPTIDLEELKKRMMGKRSKVIHELVQTEKDYLIDLELCIKEVVQPLRDIQVVDVDRLFINIESVSEVSAKLLSKLEEAIAEADPQRQIIGEAFIEIKSSLEEVYKIYCYHHDDANSLLKSYEKDEEVKRHFRNCVLSLKKIYDSEGKPNLLDMGSLMIKPVQRVMKYPLLLGELWNSTPECHPDNKPLEEALAAVKRINTNINEFKRRKDIVMKYKRNEELGTLMNKLNRLSIHSFRKNASRVTSHLKILTGGESQVKDERFDKEEKMFRNLEKAVRQLGKNVYYYFQHTQEIVSLVVENAEELQIILQDPDKSDSHAPPNKKNSDNPYVHFKDKLERMVLIPLSTLQSMFSAPQKLIQKRYDKLLDYDSRLERSSPDELEMARRDYEALNAQLVEELQVFNLAAKKILINCIYCFVALLRDLMDSASRQSPSIQNLLAPLSNIHEVQNSVMEELNNLIFVKENAPKLNERKLSFDKPKKYVHEIPRQSEAHRSKLLSSHSPDKLYQLKRNCNATQEQDLRLFEGELVAVLEQQDPFGSTSRWFVDTGSQQGYVYSSFLKQYNPTKEHNGTLHNQQEDFDNISLFISGNGSSSLKSFSIAHSDSSSSINGMAEVDGNHSCGESDDQQIFYAVYAFEARSEQELSLQEYQHVRIVKFCDVSGNKDWWLAEANGQKGYVPANYLGKMSYA
ncbi:rho guanine nucleotide exchange factor 38-like isoform X1 [Acipenser oxyrinchus oxyrinchus]|uniref:Rho guanine nucleotide exchange factor 38-like isoform X1 n=1 Tax=Acipenser oxyrinchus oxyrinchus TaxID=40147 RepID=A0AAD8LTV8_ACIOX|nr:rho guanine nucleotide exchange factor 38-like isoform X1 [Acipenser oxyrinchus oxyrinchus]